MRVAVTTSRMPCSVDAIRKLGRMGHMVVATDSIETAPGNHSRYASMSCVTAAPRTDTLAFVKDIAALTREEAIDLIVPGYEEVFYLAQHRDQLPPWACFFPSLEVLETLQHTGRLFDLVAPLGVRVPAHQVVESRAELAGALQRLPKYFAKPVCNRTPSGFLTNAGPHAGSKKSAGVEPTQSCPWIVQEFVDGEDVSTLSVVHDGRITGHVSYEHGPDIEPSRGTVFESVDEPECLSVARKIAEATSYTGQLALHFKRTKQGMVLLECNPRPSAGIHLMSDELFVEALADQHGSKLREVPAGERQYYSLPILRAAIPGWREEKMGLANRAKEAIADLYDVYPTIRSILTFGHANALRKQGHDSAHANAQQSEKYLQDVSWSGSSRVERQIRAA